VFKSLKKVIFVHGCFWHGHICPRGNRLPKSNQNYWTPKITRTTVRDRETLLNLSALGWKVLIVWECELNNDIERTQARILKFLES
jgi:DNA mismatch endonuclease (patch repair protein)